MHQNAARRFAPNQRARRPESLLDLSAIPCLERLCSHSETLEKKAFLFQFETIAPINGDDGAKICNFAEFSDTIVSHGDETRRGDMTTSTFGSTISTFLTASSKSLLSFAAVLSISSFAFGQETPIAPGGIPKPPPPPIVKCEMVSTSTLDNPGDYGMVDKNGKPLVVGVPITYPDLVLFKAYCYVSNASLASVAKEIPIPAKHMLDLINFPPCASNAGKVCSFYQRVDSAKALTANRVLIAEFLIQNQTDAVAIVKSEDLKGRTENAEGFAELQKFARVDWSPNDTPIYPSVRDAKCRVIASGALDAIDPDVEVPEVRVSNGKLLFTAAVTGAVGSGAEVTSIKWNGGPDQNGLWENPPLNVTSTVMAAVKIKAGKTLACSIKVKPVGQNYTVGLARFGDCGFFGGLKNYYFWDVQNKKPQTDGFNPPLMFPGNVVQYGKDAPDVPFRGVTNVAASLDGTIEVGTNGDVVIPTVDKRKFNRAILVAKAFNKSNNTAGEETIAWGELDPSNYAVSQMALLKNVGENETVVFQAYLAAAQIVNGIDIRGTSEKDALPLYKMNVGDKSRAYDYVVPFVNSSCSVMTIGVPNRKDKEIGPQLAGLKMCTFSKPYQLKDLASGRVTLDIMHITPEHATHAFPPGLLKSMAKAGGSSCNDKDPIKRECWNVKASDLGVSAEESAFTTHEKCRETKTITTPTKVCGAYGCQMINIPTTITVYKPNCKVEEQNECGPSMALRFSGYNQMMMASLGCAVKYNRPGEQVTATLVGQGILPYTAFGGAAPAHYDKYPKSYGASNGYACIPCRFASDAVKVGAELEKDTAPIPVDTDPKNPRLPIYTFSKGSASKDCVKDVTFEVRYFGAKACDDAEKAKDPNAFCTSGNIGTQSCSTSDATMTATSPFSGGGNIAGAFRIPICPGSGIDYDSVSVSWSPIIVDVAGNGITISRSFDLARQFDIRGDTKMRVLDWPLNNEEVAFLVRPDKNGNVTSIKELFGDYKAKNGFASMAKLDSNKDGVLSRKDKNYKELALWFDRNRNAKLDAGEIEGLEIHGVFELPLNFTKPGRKGAEGKTLHASYFNHKAKRYMNVEDHYFYEYITSGQKMSQK